MQSSLPNPSGPCPSEQPTPVMPPREQAVAGLLLGVPAKDVALACFLARSLAVLAHRPQRLWELGEHELPTVAWTEPPPTLISSMIFAGALPSKADLMGNIALAEALFNSIKNGA